MRIINLRDFNANPNPLFAANKIVKVQDLIRIQNCLFVHDYLNNCLPSCFDDYYFKLNYLYFNIQTRNANLGCLFLPSKNTTNYGLNSITQKCINNWNFFSKALKMDLSSISRYNLKTKLTQYFLKQY